MGIVVVAPEGLQPPGITLQSKDQAKSLTNLRLPWKAPPPPQNTIWNLLPTQFFAASLPCRAATFLSFSLKSHGRFVMWCDIVVVLCSQVPGCLFPQSCNRDTGQSCLISDSNRIAACFSPLRIMLAMRLSYIIHRLYYVGVCSLQPFLRTFIMKVYWILLNAVFKSIEMTMWFLSLNLFIELLQLLTCVC